MMSTLRITLAEEDLKYFEDFQKNYPEYYSVKTEDGFDMTSTTQVIVELADKLEVLAPTILAAVEMVLLHRIQVKQNEISERETRLHEKELELEKEKLLFEKEKDDKNSFELRLSSNGDSEVLIKTSDLGLLQENPDNLPQFMDKIKQALGIKNDAE